MAFDLNPITGPIFDVSGITNWAQSNVEAPPQKTDSTWYRAESISGTNWNALFPYQLLVVQQQGNGTYTQLADPEGSWVFTLPIPPQSFSISMPFAINTSVTMGGYVEEHNGAPVRMIRLAGTTGIAFGRDNAPLPPGFDFRNSIIAGTSQAALVTANAAQQLISPTFVNNTHKQAEYDDPSGQQTLTGWFQFRLLQIFFEAYAEFKKTADGRRARLALATYKDEAVYLVSPQSFDVDKSADAPLEYRYNIALKATKRIKLAKGQADIVEPYTPIQANPGGLANTLNKLQQARVVVQGAKQTISAIGGDVERDIFEPIRQTTLLVKDLLGVPITVADMSDSIIQDMKTAIIQLASTKNAIANFPANTNRAFSTVSKNAQQITDNINALAAEQVDDSNPVAAVTMSRAAHPANSPFLNPSDNFDFFSLIPIGTLNLSPQVMSKVAGERARVRALKRVDYQAMRNQMKAASDAFSNAINAGNATYNMIYGLTAPATVVIENPSNDDFNTLFALNETILEISRLAVTDGTTSSARLNAIAYIAGLASAAGIAFKIPQSKFAVPFPYGMTLEKLAYRYLQDSTRWMEIAALNGLQSPYVDEEGFILPLLVNGADNTVVVGDTTHLFVGQPVWIGSTIVVRTQRTITGITRISSAQYLVSLDGDADLDQYVTINQASLQAFLPNTVNSQQTIFIPSDTQPKDDEFTTQTIPGIDYSDSLLAVGGIDLLLTPQNDLVITPDGDSRWAVGLTNIVQKVRLALSTVQGTLQLHPEYGLPIQAGMSLADLTAAQVVQAAKGMFAGDATFSGIQAASISISGPVAQLKIAVNVAGTSQVIPISQQVRM
jgi:hypothetical protein